MVIITITRIIIITRIITVIRIITTIRIITIVRIIIIIIIGRNFISMYQNFYNYFKIFILVFFKIFD